MGKSQNGKGQNQNGKGSNQKKGGKGKDTKETNEYDKMVNTSNITRGKHHKIRKMKNKYGDQDDEERQMRMALTGSKKVTGFDI